MTTSSAATLAAPEPRALPLIGHVLELRKDPLKFMLDAAEQHGDVVRLRLGMRPTYLISNPDDIKVVLKDQYKSFTKRTGLYSVLQVYLGDGLLTSEGEPWLNHRKMIVPVFYHKRLGPFADTITRASAEMFDRWTKHADSGEPLNIGAEFTALALKIIAETVLGIEALKDVTEIEHAMDAVQLYCANRLYSLVPLPLFVPTPSNLRTRRAIKTFDETAYRFIDSRQQSGNFGDDVLSYLLLAKDEQGKGLSRKEMRDEVVTLFNTGHDTTAHALTWTCWALSRLPEVLGKLVAEVDALQGRTPGVEDLPNLAYTARVFRESTRLYPPAWILARIAREDVELGGVKMKAGSQLLISAYVVHHLSRVWSRPLEFMPERWEEEPRPFSYLAFGGGAHRCIGEGFAMMEAPLVMAQLLQRFRLEECPQYPVVPEPLITMRPKNGLFMYVRHREAARTAAPAANG